MYSRPRFRLRWVFMASGLPRARVDRGGETGVRTDVGHEISPPVTMDFTSLPKLGQTPSEEDRRSTSMLGDGAGVFLRLYEDSDQQSQDEKTRKKEVLTQWASSGFLGV